MNKKILFSLLFLVFTSCNHPPVKDSAATKDKAELSCKLPGHSINWVTSYCKLKTGIADVSSRVIVKCADDMEKSLPPVEECPKRALIKKEICTLRQRLSRTEKGHIHCMQASENDKAWGNGDI